MSLNTTPSGERAHIAFFGCRNAGKSSLLNAVTGQQLAIVSDVKGTTTDPVYKALELLPAGPVVIIDTPGLDDVGELGEQRIASALKVLRKTDLAVLAVDGTTGIRDADRKIIEEIKSKNIPYIVVFTKKDLCEGAGLKANAMEASAGESVETSAADTETKTENLTAESMSVSSVTGEGIWELKERIAKLLVSEEKEKVIAADLVEPGDVVVLVIPIDKAAPKGRLILPQQQVIRDLLDHGSIPVVCRDTELRETLDKLGNLVRLVITDSQAFKRVGEIVSAEIPLTSFSILFSRYKGELETQLASLRALDNIKDGDKVLVAEGCTHHRQCGDIGTEKIPALLRNYTKADFDLEFRSGQDFPMDLSQYKLVIHCGGCMLNEKEMQSRIGMANEQLVPITNYGMLLAKMTGILDRSIAPLKK